MRYFYLEVRTDENKGGSLIKKMSVDYEINDKQGIYSFRRIDFPDIDEIKYLLLTKGGKLNDVLSAIMLKASGLLINERTKRIISKFNLPPHKYYKAFVKDYQGNIHDYFWLQTSSERNCDNFLNYPESQFYWKKDVGNMEREHIAINSIEDVKTFVENLPLGQTVKLKTAVIKKEFADLNIDFFKIGRLSIEWIISERLKVALENANITGVSFKEATNILVEE